MGIATDVVDTGPQSRARLASGGLGRAPQNGAVFEDLARLVDPQLFVGMILSKRRLVSFISGFILIVFKCVSKSQPI